jgi:hypothetical protein
MAAVTAAAAALFLVFLQVMRMRMTAWMRVRRMTHQMVMWHTRSPVSLLRTSQGRRWGTDVPTG